MMDLELLITYFSIVFLIGYITGITLVYFIIRKRAKKLGIWEQLNKKIKKDGL